jgi:hypothetical protein
VSRPPAALLCRSRLAPPSLPRSAVGAAAEAHRGALSLTHPVVGGCVSDWEAYAAVVGHALGKEHLNTPLEDQPVRAGEGGGLAVPSCPPSRALSLGHAPARRDAYHPPCIWKPALLHASGLGESRPLDAHNGGLIPPPFPPSASVSCW